MGKNRGCLIVLAVVALLAFAFLIWASVYTEVAWFGSLGVAGVWWKRVGTQWLLLIGGWVVATLVLGLNWRLARMVAGGGQMTVPWLRRQATQNRVTAEPTTRVVVGRVADALLVVAAAVMGFFFALPARAFWLTALMSRRGVAFGQTDPVLGRDLGFYVFRLPWQSALQSWFLWLVVIALGGAALVYLASLSAARLTGRVQVLSPTRGRFLLRLPARAERHLLVLGAAALGLIAWGYQLSIPQLLYSTGGAAYGAGYADIHARLPVLQLLTAIAALAAAILIANLFVRVRWLPYATVAAWLLVAFVGGSVYPSILQRVAVEPNELAREREYIDRTIKFTRAAFGLNQVVEADLAVSEEAVPLDLVANETTIKNIRLWDYRPLLKTYSQLQEIRLYYAFQDVDVDRYQVGDDYRQVMLAGREISQNELPETAQTWVNRHLVYTHGSGVVLSPVNEVLEEGLPRLWVRDIPPRTAFPDLQISRPEIYHGELTSDYVIVKTGAQELDYPAGDQNVYTTYEGSGGVVLDSPLKRLAYAARLQSSQILFSNSITRESRLLWRRAIDERLRTIAPFLRYDTDPYLVIANGRLVWLIDAYTVTSRYPYSEPIETTAGTINYIRNPVKVAVDAYEGTANFYLLDPNDPLAATYNAIFPGLFRPAAEMDPALVAHWRYPEGMFRIQATKYQTFHMQDAQVFYNQEDLWNWPEELAGGERQRIEPYYVIMRLPGQTEPEFVLMMPYTPSTKQNMIAWLYARCDGAEYGRLGVFKFPKQVLVYGPMQVESRIDQDPLISQQLSLWNQRGSQVIRGNLLVIPVDRGILYVEPIYLQAEASQLPELRRIVVAYGNRIAMEETLAAGLAKVLGTSVVTETPSEPGTTLPPLEGDAAELVLQADRHYQAAQECLKVGDWGCYGTAMDQLEQVLTALVAATEKQP